MVQMFFPSDGGIYQDDNSLIDTPEVFNICLRSMKMHFKNLPGRQSRQT